FFFSSRRRHTRFSRDWSSDVCSSDLFSVTRWADVLQVSRSAPLFSSHLGGTMIEDASELDLAGIRLMMLNMDPPEHTKLRALVKIGRASRRERAERSGDAPCVD